MVIPFPSLLYPVKYTSLSSQDLQIPTHHVDDIVEAVNEGKEITKADLQRCAKHILSVALKTM